MRDSSEKSVRILLVDDNAADVYLLCQSLKECALDCEFLLSADGEDALRRLKREGKYISEPPPELVVLDLNLPKVDGGAVIEAIREDDHLRHLCVVVLSSSAAPRDRMRFAGMTRGIYLQKPADLDGYLALGRRISDFWRDCGSQGTGC